MDFTQPWDFGDITFVIEEKRIYANKGVLSMSSAVFRAMFTSEFAEKKMTEIPLPDKKFDNFLELMQILHPTHNNYVNDTNVDHILPLAHEYQIHQVFENCATTLLKQPPTLLKLNLAEKYDMSKLHEKCLVCVKKIPLSELRFKAGYEDIKPQTLTEVITHQAKQLERLKAEVEGVTHDSISGISFIGKRINSKRKCAGTSHNVGTDRRCPACLIDRYDRYDRICNIFNRY